MADNTTINAGTGGDIIATDDLTTLNGGAVSGFKVQRVKVGFGSDSALRDVDSSNGLPVSGAFSARNPVSGTLSANDAVVAAPIGDGTLINGTSTAGSVVSATIPDGAQTWVMMIKSYTSGTIYTEGSINSTNGTDGDWVELKGRKTGTAVGIESVSYSMVSNGIWRGNCSGFIYIRARLIGGGTGATINFSISTAMGPTFLNSGIPGGSSRIGDVTVDGISDGTLTAAWNGTSKSCAGFGDIMIEFIGITGGDSYTINGSGAGATFKTLTVINLANFTLVSSIVTDGIYIAVAPGFVSFTKTGSASTPTVNLVQKR